MHIFDDECDDLLGLGDCIEQRGEQLFSGRTAAHQLLQRTPELRRDVEQRPQRPRGEHAIAGTPCPTRIGELAVKSGVRISRLQYTPGAEGPDLTEITLDAGIAGEYSQIMHFVNDLERDQTFFVIRAMGLTSQQGGLVNLRLRVSTWVRPGDVPPAMESGDDKAPVAATAPTKEGD